MLTTYDKGVEEIKPETQSVLISCLHRFSNYVWNVWRRPQVKRWQTEVIQLSQDVHSALCAELLPILYDNMRAGCSTCSFHYSFLKTQPFVSQIELALTKSSCLEHIEVYMDFHEKYEALFDKSHEIADRICGFKSNRK